MLEEGLAGAGAEAVGAADSTSRRGHGVSECCGGSRQVTNDMRWGAWSKSQASLHQPAASPPKPSSPVTWRTKLLDVVSEDVLPSDLLNRPFLLLYLPWRGGEGTRVKSERPFPSSPPTGACAKGLAPGHSALPHPSPLLLEVASLKGKRVFHLTDTRQQPPGRTVQESLGGTHRDPQIKPKAGKQRA